MQTYTPGTSDYPLNFAANAFTADNRLAGKAQNVLPIGRGGTWVPSQTQFVFSPGEGIYGASYTAAGAIYKNLGYLPTGYDGIDNDQDGEIDNWNEGVNSTNSATVLATIQNHQHHTARAEMLYALLVEGMGPLGSYFNRDDFTDSQVQDTDNDGLPEFVDAWGQPLQFFRWPILYSTDVQKGQVINNWNYSTNPVSTYSNEVFQTPYASAYEFREVDPLDPNNQLLSPMWWLGTAGANQNYGLLPTQGGFFAFPGLAAANLNASYGVNAFEYYFHRLTEPFQHNRQLYALLGSRHDVAVRLPPGLLHQAADPLGRGRPDAGGLPHARRLGPSTFHCRQPDDHARQQCHPVRSGGLYRQRRRDDSHGSDDCDLGHACDYGKDDITNQNRTAGGGTGGS